MKKLIEAIDISRVGFGISKDGHMAGADIVIGGVTSNGKTYFSV